MFKARVAFVLCTYRNNSSLKSNVSTYAALTPKYTTVWKCLKYTFKGEGYKF